MFSSAILCANRCAYPSFSPTNYIFPKEIFAKVEKGLNKNAFQQWKTRWELYVGNPVFFLGDDA